MEARIAKIHYDKLLVADFSETERQLCASAKQATSLAYAPYSKFRVGAAALLENGKIIQAANLENAAYPQCLCAEATLLGTLHTQYPAQKIVSIAVAVTAENQAQEVAAPCGSCRQQLFEAERRNEKPIKLYLRDKDGGALRFESMASLLPFGFVL